jgi:predicted TIM-barrel fold metal-dependent hydrolase
MTLSGSRGVFLAVLGLCLAIAMSRLSAGPSAPSMVAAEPVRALTLFIEAHAHFETHDSGTDIRSALEALDRENAAAMILLPPPDTFKNPRRYDAEVILPAAKAHPRKLAVLGGGGTLNAMIHESVTSGSVSPEVRKRFRDRAEELLREGVVGFGEMTAEHFAGITPYQYAPADHPLFLLLADVAAQRGVPIDLHMEAVPEAMPLPAHLKSPPNAAQLHENISAFERLLAHDPRAKIIWAHAGSDGTGYRTPALCRRLLQAHPNLYMEIKVDPRNTGKTPLLVEGKLQPDWLQLFLDFPDRFIIGSDQHYPEPAGAQQRWQATVLLFNQLPADVRRKVGTENVLRLYPLRLESGGKIQ